MFIQTNTPWSKFSNYNRITRFHSTHSEISSNIVPIVIVCSPGDKLPKKQKNLHIIGNV